jgi:hypothetical protein
MNIEVVLTLLDNLHKVSLTCKIEAICFTFQLEEYSSLGQMEEEVQDTQKKTG